MEPSGRNQSQPVANGMRPKTARTSETVAVGCDQLPHEIHGKEGSTVRVRQRALQKPCKSQLFLST
jgi:hypothetical protein